MTADDARRLALALPETTEQDHWGAPSFRIRGHIFATLPPNETLNVMVDMGETKAVVAAEPDIFEELWWGKRLRGVRIKLPRADETVVAELLDSAWRLKAPKRLACSAG